MLGTGGATSNAVWASGWAIDPPPSKPVYGGEALDSRTTNVLGTETFEDNVIQSPISVSNFPS